MAAITTMSSLFTSIFSPRKETTTTSTSRDIAPSPLGLETALAVSAARKLNRRPLPDRKRKPTVKFLEIPRKEPALIPTKPMEISKPRAKSPAKTFAKPPAKSIARAPPVKAIAKSPVKPAVKLPAKSPAKVPARQQEAAAAAAAATPVVQQPAKRGARAAEAENAAPQGETDAESAAPQGETDAEGAAPPAPRGEAEAENAASWGEAKNQHAFEKLMDHRWAGHTVEIQVKWADGDLTWEQEATLHEDALEALLEYWDSQGGRPINPRGADLFDIHAILKHTKDGKNLLVEWLGYGPEEASWVPRTVIEETAPEVVAEYWQRVRGSRPGRGRGRARTRCRGRRGH